MILTRFRETPEIRKNCPCSAFRWTFQIEYNFIGFIHQYNLNGWKNSHTSVYGISIRKNFRFGIDHDYYDGPHCSLSIGLISFIWCGKPFTGWCKKCWPDDENWKDK
jgi:hypothetical protein